VGSDPDSCRDVKSLPRGRNPPFFTVEVKVGSCDSIKTAMKIMGGGGGLGGVRTYILSNSYFGLSDNHRILREILPRAQHKFIGK
jgi:hypothetical protein